MKEQDTITYLRNKVNELERSLKEKTQEIENLRLENGRAKELIGISDALDTILDYLLKLHQQPIAKHGNISRDSRCNPALYVEINYDNIRFKGKSTYTLINDDKPIRTLGDAICIGRRGIIKRRNVGAKVLSVIEDILQENGLWWNVDIRYYNPSWK